MAVHAGNTFLDTTDNPHLWIVVAGPDLENKVIIVSLTSLKGRDDRTTICEIHEHPFITKRSGVAYKHADHVDVETLEASLKEGVFKARDDCSGALLKKIADGIMESNSTPLGIQNVYARILRAQNDAAK